MIAIDVEFLTRRYVATQYNRRGRAEWPPHPARLYSALTAAWAEEEDEVEAEALDLLAEAGAPDIYADDDDAVSRRTVINVYVPDRGPSLLTRAGTALKEADRARRELEVLLDQLEVSDPRHIKKARTRAANADKRARETLAREIAAAVDSKAATIETGLALLPETRGKQPRTFPSITPERPHVTFVWPDADLSGEQRAALAALLSRVVRIGHSSSLVACRLITSVPDGKDGRKHWIPVQEGDTRLRVVHAGQRERLRADFQRHRETEPRVLPFEPQAYEIRSAEARESSVVSVFGTDWIVFREIPDTRGRRLGLPLTRAADLARALRGALMKHADQPPLEVITGHTPDGRPLERPHLAFVSLASVMTRWASGSVLGVAIVLPRGASMEERRAVLRAVGRWEESRGGAPLELRLGRVGAMWIERVVDGDVRVTLEPRTWCAASRHWASVTPVALDQNPGDLAARNPAVASAAVRKAREIIARACERVGLPAPSTVEILRRSVFQGSPPARYFMPFPAREGALRRVCIHAELVFDEPVSGPVLLGAGRYQGLGLFMPVRDGNAGGGQ